MKVDLRKNIRKIPRVIGFETRPSFMIIGAQKAGTTALYDILNQHSLVKGASLKEVHYFDNDDWYNKKKLHEYHSFFPLSYTLKDEEQCFEATPLYLYHPKVAQRLFKYNPNLKLIVILRNPTYRALSSWIMYHYHFKKGINKRLYDPRTFKEVIENDIKNISHDDFYSNPLGYIKRGIYLDQLEKYYEYFKRDQIFIIENNELKDDFSNSINKLLSFLNLPYEPLKKIITNQSQKKHSEYQEEIKILNEFYKPYNKKLYDFLGYKYNWL